jgi:hypothetical protein
VTKPGAKTAAKPAAKIKTPPTKGVTKKKTGVNAAGPGRGPGRLKDGDMGAKLDRGVLQTNDHYPLTKSTDPAKYVGDLMAALAGQFKVETIIGLFLKAHPSVADIRAHMVSQFLAAKYPGINTAEVAETNLIKALKAARSKVTRQRGATTKG